MVVRIGNPAYSLVEGFGSIEGDMLSVNSTIYIDEGRILKTDTGYLILIIANAITDLARPEEFKPGTAVYFHCHNAEYTRWTKENPKLPTPVTPLECLITDWLDSTEGSQWVSKSFKGKLHLIGSESIISMIKNSGVWHALAQFEECEENLIKKDVGVKAKRSNGTASNIQKEIDRLVDKLTFAITQTNEFGEGSKDLIELSISLSQMKKESPEVFEIYFSLLKSILN